MVDYTRATGASGTLIIRDHGSAVEFLIQNTQGATNAFGKSWSGTVNGSSVGGSFSINGVQTVSLGTWSVTTNQTVTLTMGATGTSGLGGPTTFSVAISRDGVPGTPPSPVQLFSTQGSVTVEIGNPAYLGPGPYTRRVEVHATTGGAVAGVDNPGTPYTFNGLAPGTWYNLYQRLSNALGWSSWSAAGQALTVPADPTGLSVTRVSDTSQTVAWTTPSTTTSMLVQRRVDGGAWTQVATVTGSSWSDTTTVANRKYEYRVAAKNQAGTSGWSAVGTVFTTPAAPTGVSAVRSGSNIVVSASGVPPWATSFDVRDGTTVIATSVSLPYTHVSPSNTVSHTYTVRARTNSLISAYSANSNTVQLPAPPNAPTQLAPNGATRTSDAAVVLSWQHNPVDSAPQAAFEVQRRVNGGSWTTTAGTTSSQLSVSVAAGTLEWQGRTRSTSHASFGPWSATATVTVIDRPGVAITSPGPVWDAASVTVSWSWTQAQSYPQSAWQVELLDADGVVWTTAQGAGAGTSVTLPRRVTEGQWTVRVRAATGEVWSAWAVSSFDVVFYPPEVPTLSAGWDESDGCMNITVAPVTGDYPTVRILVERSLDGIVWETIAQTTTAAALTDWESWSFGDVQIRATAFTAEGATASSVVTVPVRSSAVWLSAGNSFEITARLPFDPKVEITAGRQRTLKQYAGRSLPVALVGDALQRVVTVSGSTSDLDSDTASASRLTEIAQSPSERFLFRDPDGNRIYGSIQQISLPRQSSQWHPDGWDSVWGYSFALTETETR